MNGGLDYYRARYYDPTIGRFISEDPIGFQGGSNFYSYVGNNPVLYLDAFGLKAGDPYPTPDAAAIDALLDVIQGSICEKREYPGAVYRRKDGQYSYTSGQTGDKYHVKVPDSSSLPPNSTLVGAYHTHGAYDPYFDGENFSEAILPGRENEEDKEVLMRLKILGYLGTPRGAFKKFDPFTNSSKKVTYLRFPQTNHNQMDCNCSSGSK